MCGSACFKSSPPSAFSPPPSNFFPHCFPSRSSSPLCMLFGHRLIPSLRQAFFTVVVETPCASGQGHMICYVMPLHFILSQSLQHFGVGGALTIRKATSGSGIPKWHDRFSYVNLTGGRSLPNTA
eukprot:2192375-Rhodomonas_salina.1